jgi:rod shape-determining protein MreB
MAAAIGAGVSVFEPTGVMIVDIGGGTTEIAVISLGGIVVNRSIKLAGTEMDQAIINYVRLRHGLIIGEKTAEDTKIKIGSAFQKSEKRKAKNAKEKGTEEEELESRDKVAVIRGRSVETGLPRSLKISESEVREAIGPVISQIIDSIEEVIEETPPELTSDILEHGILLTGGGSMISGIDELILDRTKVPVTLVKDPLTTVVRGCATLLEDQETLNRVKVTGGLR